ncbi:MAG TPA: hypothetical protein VEQ66_14210 [Propionibacteriaceae bacterium]|nr:hypothetical protein [Propionibacteriaceae bacterium]
MTRLGSTDATTGISRRTDLMLTAAVLALFLIAGAVLAVTGTTTQVLDWAWERHANILSWYIRPLFLLPLAFFAYRRSLAGIVLTLIALATSMAWFPAPERVQPEVAEFLAFERDWLTSGMTPEKVLSWSFAFVGLAALCLAFWKRSLAYGLVVITTLALGKMAWGVIEGRGTGWAMLIPAITGLIICNGAVLYAMRRRIHRSARERSHDPADSASQGPDAESLPTMAGPRGLR